MTAAPPLRCAGCGANLTAAHSPCPACGWRAPLLGGWPSFVREADVAGADRLMRRVYDGAPSLHDPFLRLSFPLLMGERSSSARARIHAALRLEELPTDREVHVLDVGVGTGGDLPGLRGRLAGRAASLSGCDLSRGMLGVLRRRGLESGQPPIAPVLADVHALPWPDASFDRVLHIGAVNNFRDRRCAIGEMTRVLRPGGRIVLVDEELAAHQRHSLLDRLAFRAITFYDPAPAAPLGDLPDDADNVEHRPLNRFFYLLSFTRRPAGAPPPPPAS